MPGVLNATPVTSQSYTDAVTVMFAQPRQSITVILAANGAAYYQLGFVPHPGVANTRDITWEHNEHHLIPGAYVFDDPAAEGLPPGSLFAGIRFRAVTVAQTAVVTVA